MGIGTERVSGTLTSWNDDRGFGFISRTDTSQKTFVHISAFPPRAHRPQLGEAITFEVGLSPDGKQRATRVQPVVHAPALPSSMRRTPGAGIRRRSGTLTYLPILGFVIAYLLVNAIWPIPLWVPALYLLASCLCFLLYAADKAAAVSGGWRTSEKALILAGTVGGWPGGIVAQQVLRHKTRKARFRFAFWNSVVVNLLAFALFTTPLFTVFARWGSAVFR
ncbi:hypothetical protein ASH00_04215 [Arthrobacter sp. Soil782]|uniref:DUF1294 domain-containing protein n=1 Tax=Arthrobacter sp. Soil782 TaxID=1736410 RepID=UPI0006F5D8DD|nr:DUF1294 domain-containing protein [Arthrobacter sp. Soil782]KRF08892.1 hypothetical protein ASH00_04215 [Arthrobacter sp. Soil782]